MTHRLLRRITALVTLAAVVGLLAGPSLAGLVDSTVVVNPDPVGYTPHVLDGKVEAIEQIGNTVIVAGLFTQVRNAADPTVISRVNIFAFDADTGLVSNAFVPVVDGEVTSLNPSPDGASIFLGGLFNKVNGTFSKAVAKVRVADGQLTPGFSAWASARVMHLAVSGNRLFLGGFFSTVNGTARTALAAIDATTGALDPSVNLLFEGPRKAGGTPHILKLDVTPDASKLVAIGNFTTIAGQRRDQVAIIDLAGTATVSSWATTRYQQSCAPIFETYMRDVDISPDGTFFAIVTSGAGFTGSLCDTAARWETSVTGADLQPTWVNYTGGDTLFSVAATSSAVYVGGHQRWLNNPFARDALGAGGVSREGIAALDPQTGLPFQWNPGRTRGVGAFELTVTPKGLYVGSDTDRLGAGEYHGRVALLPLVGGTATPPNVVSPLPNDLYLAGPTNSSLGGPTSLLRGRLTPLGPQKTIADPAGSAVDWSVVRGAFMVNGRLYSAQSDGRVYERDFDGTTLGGPRVVNLFGLTSSQLPVASITGMFYAQGRVYYTLTSDTRLYSRWFLPESEIFGAETFVSSGATDGLSWTTRGMDYAAGRIYYTTSGGELWSMALVNGVPDGATALQVDGGRTTDWRSRDLFIFNGPGGSVRSNANPTARPTVSCSSLTCAFDGSTSTDADGTVFLYSWSFSDGSTAQGATTSRTFSTGGSKTATLTVTDDSGASASSVLTFTVVNPANQMPQARISASCSGPVCHLDASASTDPDGTIAGASWDFGDGTSGRDLVVDHEYVNPGTYTVTLTITDNQSGTGTATTGVTAMPATNPRPTALATAVCTDRTCHFDGSGSSDPNDRVSSYAWTFGDGTTGTGAVVDHVYATDGTYPVTLTVTDNGGAASNPYTTSVRVALVAFRGATTWSGFSETPTIRTPAAVQPGDGILLFLTLDNSTSTVTAPPGWTEVKREVDAPMRTIVWTRVAGASDASLVVPITPGAKVHFSLMTLAYSGTSQSFPVMLIASASEDVTRTSHATPPLVTSAPSWVVSYVADLGTTTALTKPASHRVRGVAYGTETPHLSAMATENTTTLPAGTQGKAAFTANASSGTATMFTIALAPNA